MMGIKELFEERNQAYKQKTNAILKTIIHVLEGAMIAFKDDIDVNVNVIWQDARIMPSDGSSDDLIVIVGFIQLQPGEVIVLDNGETVYITEKNTEAFRRVLRIGIPLAIAESSNIEEVTKFFREKKGKNYENFDELEEILGGIENIHADAGTAIMGFDISKLSTEQIQQLIVNTDENKKH